MILFYNAWVALSLVLYYFGPVPWPGRSGPGVAIYVLVCLACFDLGYRLARRSPGLVRPLSILPRSKRLARLAVAAWALLTFIYLATLTGRWVIDPSAYSLNFGDVYSDYGRAVAERQVTPLIQLVMLAKACLFPIALTVFIQRFRTDVIIVVTFLVPMIVSSLFRGTDKEVIDVLILLFVAAVLHRLASWRVAAVAVLVPVALWAFLLRRLGRFGGDLPHCLPGSEACFDYQSTLARMFGERMEVLYVFVTNYLANGYQGLSYALGLAWQPNFGLGQLPPVKRTLCSVLGVACELSDYQSALTSTGWNASTRWTTAYTVLANDLSFVLVPVWLVVLGIVFARSLAMWRGGQDAAAGAAIALITIFWVYSSANMQIGITMDWAAATLLFVYVAPWRRVRSSP